MRRGIKVVMGWYLIRMNMVEAANLAGHGDRGVGAHNDHIIIAIDRIRGGGRIATIIKDILVLGMANAASCLA